MANFIAFRFTDNDFHWPLRQAIQYIVDNGDPDMSLEGWREFTLRGMIAFNMIRRLDDFALKNPMPDTGCRSYFEKTLQVQEIDRVGELDAAFEGYLYNRHTGDVLYQGY